MPQFLGLFAKRIPIARLLKEGSGLVAGRAGRDADGSIFLKDSSGTLPLQPSVSKELEALPCWLALTVASPGQQDIVYQQPLMEHPTFVSQSPARLLQRWHIHQALRTFFTQEGFLEVDTPLAVSCPGMEPYLDSYVTGSHYLRTSPELHMKRLLAAGIDPIFQLGPCFRAGDLGSKHRPEFLMLEWYRLFADLDAIAQDIHKLLQTLSPFSTQPSYFEKELEVITCAQLFEQYAGIHLTNTSDKAPLRQACQNLGLHFCDSDDWDTLFFRIFIDCIEPKLGQTQPTLVTNYPASQAALAKTAPSVPGEMPYCFRFELFIKGIEIANAFYELTDPKEQRRRFIADQHQRRALDKPVYEIDEQFMAALEQGLPPAAGIALGVDRLVLALLGLDHFDKLLPFP